MKKYSQKYKRSWETKFSWLEGKENKAFCTACDKVLHNNICYLKRHELSKYRTKNIEEKSKSRKIQECFPKEYNNSKIKKLKAEIAISLYCVKHNLSYQQTEPLSTIINYILRDSGVSNLVLSMGRKKLNSFIQVVLGPFALLKLTECLKTTKYSIIIDETTDISVMKHLVIITRYYDINENKVNDKFLSLVELSKSSSDEILQKIIDTFEKLAIPLENCIGFSSDNASVMVGSVNGVRTKLNDYLKHDLFSIGCTCHSLNLCASNANKVLPKEVEKTIRDIYFHFGHSPKRISDYQKFHNSFNAPIHKIIKFCPTRWLSLEKVIERILEQERVLINYFTLYKFENDKDKTISDILEFLSNKKNIILLKFLLENLAEINKYNLIFQSEQPQIHLLNNLMEKFLLNGLYAPEMKFRIPYKTHI